MADQRQPPQTIVPMVAGYPGYPVGNTLMPLEGPGLDPGAPARDIFSRIFNFNYSEPGATPAPAAPAEPFAFSGTMPEFPSFGGGYAPALVTPEARPDAPTLTVDPGLAQRAALERARADRILALISERTGAMPSHLPQPGWRGWVSHLGELAGAAAQADTLGGAGGNVQQALRDRNTREQDRLSQILGLNIQGESAVREADNADVSATSGAHATSQTNLLNQHQVETARVGDRNDANARNAAARNSAAASASAQAAALARARLEYQLGQLAQRQGLIGSLGGAASFDLFGGMAGGNAQEQQLIGRALGMRSLQSVITSAGAGLTGNQQKRAIHAAVQALNPGATIPEPPNTVARDPATLSRWYAQNGVNLNTPGVRDAFPAIAAEE